MSVSEQLVNRKVAVYGTLRSGLYNHSRLVGSEFIDTDTIQGFKMYDYGAFPYIVQTGDPNDSIVVEVYSVPDLRSAQSIDSLEGFSSGYAGFYDRKRVTTEKGHDVWVYLFREEDDSPVVPGGDWYEYVK